MTCRLFLDSKALLLYAGSMNRDFALSRLRQLQTALEARGVAHASLFGSVARDEGHAQSDVDIVITPAAGMRLDLIDLGGIQTVLNEGFGIDVDLVVEPVKKSELRTAILRDRVDAF